MLDLEKSFFLDFIIIMPNFDSMHKTNLLERSTSVNQSSLPMATLHKSKSVTKLLKIPVESTPPGKYQV